MGSAFRRTLQRHPFSPSSPCLASDRYCDVILLELGRAYAAKGNTAEARKVFTQLLDEHPTSQYLSDARQGLDGLKG